MGFDPKAVKNEMLSAANISWHFSGYTILKNYQCQTVWIQIRTDVMLVLIWVRTIFKGNISSRQKLQLARTELKLCKTYPLSTKTIKDKKNTESFLRPLFLNKRCGRVGFYFYSTKNRCGNVFSLKLEQYSF